MWILPRQLLTSVSAQGTEALTLDSEEFSQLAEQSLMWRSKPSPARTWLQRWKRVNWIKHLSGRTLKPATGKSFVTEWISSVAVTRVSHSQQQGSEKEKKTPDTSGHLYRGQLDLFVRDTAGLRMSKGILPSALKTSATTWESWVTTLRQEYSVRLSAAHLISAKESSSWPTPTSAEGTKIGSQANFGQVGLSNHPSIVGLPDQANPNKSGKNQELWATPRAGNPGTRKPGTGGKVLAEQAQQNWATPHVPNGGQTTSGSKDKKTKKQIQLQHQVQNWPTPLEDDANNVNPSEKRRATLVTKTSKGTGMKLNPNWVEQLMGLPRVGWTQLPTEWTGCASSETESSPPPVR